MSLGEDRVRIKFNPNANTLVNQIKQKTAELIDLCDEQLKEKDGRLGGARHDALRRRRDVGRQSRNNIAH